MKQKLSKILVTGGSGFIGSHIVDKLLSTGYEVTIIDDLSSGSFDNIVHNKENKYFHFIKGNICDKKLIEKILVDQDAIFHEAAFTSVQNSIKYPSITNEINVTGTLNLLNACLNTNVKRFIFASSCVVYGEKSISKFTENMKLNPMSPYAVSKIAAEYYVNLFYHLYGLETISLRYFNVYGLRSKINQGVIPIFINNLLNNRNIIIYGDGEQTRDFINVKDIAEANILALTSKRAIGETINIGSGIPTSINQLTNKILKIMNIENVKPIYEKAKIGDVKHGYSDVKKAQKTLDYNLKIELDDGITELINTYPHKNSGCLL